jgi:hypothetical protein
MRFRLVQALSRSNSHTSSFAVLLLCLHVFKCFCLSPDILRVATFIVRRTTLYIWQISDSVTISHIRLGLYLQVTSSLMGCPSYWAPDLDEYLWYHH